MQTTHLKNNEDIVKQATKNFNKRKGPRVGDFIRVNVVDKRAHDLVRITHDWGDAIQTAHSESGSYHLTQNGFLSYSGSLDPAIPKSDLVSTNQKIKRNIWFFDRNIAGASRGINTNILCRLFTLKEGADTSKIWATQPRMHLAYHSAPVGCGYTWTVTTRGTAHTAFKTEQELLQWLKNNNYAVAKPLNTSQSIVWPANLKH